MLNDTSPASSAHGPARNLSWFCVKTHLKHEHIAAAHLAKFLEVEVFHPRIHFVRSTRRGPVSTTESLFPSYIFARFDWHSHLNLVQYSRAVSEIVHFGNNWPTVPDSAISELRSLFGKDAIRHISTAPEIGETVLISNGVFEGLEAAVTRVMPSAQRVAVLLDFLGRQTTVELQLSDITRNIREDIARDLCPTC